MHFVFRLMPVGVCALVLAAANGAGRLDLLPGMPPVLDPNNIYSAAAPGMLSSVIKNFPSRIYVPNC
ncbi:MAG: hypothetical protein JO211_04285, partial [Acidobacteriaceae bacterium]|nr:hypothetical protein [Acidobacteriaceae bacterium]